MNVLVIGGAGYIGSHVVQELLECKHKVMVFDNLSSGLRENLFKEAAFTHGDILDYNRLLDVMQKNSFDAIIHLAAFKAAGESMISPEKYSTNNISGTVNILNAASLANIKYIVFSSSAAVYGEPKYIPVDEKHPTDPTNYYGFTKLEIERFLSWYEKLRDIRFASLRYFNAAGYDVKGRIKGKELNPANLIPIIMEAACGKRSVVQVFGNDYDTEDGTCIRDYIHVSDLASAHAKALEYITKNKKSLTVNLGTGNGISVLKVIEVARKITGKEIPVQIAGRRAGDPDKLTASALEAFQKMNWKAEYSDIETLMSTSWNIYKNDIL
jgi:UDP-glucose 4-epimerase